MGAGRGWWVGVVFCCLCAAGNHSLCSQSMEANGEWMEAISAFKDPCCRLGVSSCFPSAGSSDQLTLNFRHLSRHDSAGVIYGEKGGGVQTKGLVATLELQPCLNVP